MITTLGKERSESEIVAILKQKVSSSDSYNQSELARQRQDNYNMYYLNPLGNEAEGRSSIQSSDVFDAVEGTKAVIHEALTSGRDLLYFDPLDEDDGDLATMATRYVKDRYAENDGYRFMIDTLHDGLLAKNAVCKYYWIEDIEKSYEPFIGLSEQKFQGMVSRPDVKIMDVQQFQSIGPQGPYMVFSGTIERSNDKSRASFRLMKPEDFFGDESASTMTDSTFGSDREVLRKGEVVEDYPWLEKEIMASPKFTNSGSEDAIARKSNDDSWEARAQEEKAVEREFVEVHDCYIKLWGAKGYGIYRYKMSGQKYLLWDWPKGEDGEMLDELPEDFDPSGGEFVTDIPYLQWSPYPLSHRWDGLSQADAVRDMQLTATNLKRAVIDHTMRTINPQREANLEFIRNPRDLIDNVIGAIIDKEMAAGSGPVVTPIMQPELSPSAFSVLQMLKQETEARSSYSSLAGGLNTDAISKQNGADMIDSMINNSNRRIMMMTRNLVELFLKPLYLQLYNLGVANDKRKYNVELSGNWVQMSPQEWPERPEMKVLTAMTPAAAIQEAQNLIGFHQLISQDPEASLMYRTEHRFNLYADVLKSFGKNAIDRFIENPESDEFKAAQENMIKSQQMQQNQAMEAQKRQESILDKQLQLQEMQTKAGIEQGQQKIDNDAAYNADKQSLAEDVQEWDQEKDTAEIMLETRKINEGKNIAGVSVG